MEPILTSVGSGIIIQEIRYEMPQADEVYLGWGINGWKVAPEEFRPSGTTVTNGSMATLMAHEGNTFIVKLRVPAGTIIDYTFWISKARTGQVVGVADLNGYPPMGYQTLARPNRPATVIASLDLEKAPPTTKRIYAPLVTAKIRYHAHGMEDVFLVWGINGWQPVFEAIQPLGTVLKDNRMHTPMAHDGDAFMAKVRVPYGATLDYGFLITKMNGDPKNNIWDGAESFRQIVTEEGIIEVDANRGGAKQDAVQGEPPRNASESFVTMPYRLMLAVLVLSVTVFIVLKRRLIQTRLSSFVSVLGIHR